MTVKELYNWAVENKCENCEIFADHWSGKYLLEPPFLEDNEVYLNASCCVEEEE